MSYLMNTGEILRGASGRLYERPVRWDEETAEENACRFEHAISDDLLEVMKNFLKEK